MINLQGTFLAIIVTYITYMCYGLMIGSVYLSNASGSVGQWDVWIEMMTDDLLP